MEGVTSYRQQRGRSETIARPDSSQAPGPPRSPVSRMATKAEGTQGQAIQGRSVWQGDSYRGTNRGNTEQKKDEDKDNDGNSTATCRAFPVEDDDDDPDSPFEATVTQRRFWVDDQDRLSETDEKELFNDVWDGRGSATRLWGNVIVNGKRLPTHAMGTRPYRMPTSATGLNAVKWTVNDRFTTGANER